MRPIGVTIIGFGRWGAILARVVAGNPDFDLAAIVDVDASRRRGAAERYPGIPVFARIERALALASVEAVIIATPPLTLPRLASVAIAAGRHVFVEKPGARTSLEALDLANQAAAAHRVLFVDLTPVWSPLQDATAAILRSGAIGRLTSWRAERTNLDYGQPGIDVLRDLAIHDLAVLDDLVPARPKSIEIAEAREGVDGRLVSARIRLAYPEGFVADIVSSWRGPRQMRRTTIVGTRGSIGRDDIADPACLRLTVHGDSPDLADRDAELYPVAQRADPLALSLEAFALSVRTGAPPRTDARTAARLLDWIASAETALASRATAMIASGAAR